MTKIQLTHAVGNPEIDYTKKIMELLAGDNAEEKYKTLVGLIEYYISSKKTDEAKSDREFIKQVQAGTFISIPNKETKSHY